MTAEYVYFGGKRVAMLPAGGTPQFYAEDFLGSSRVITTSTGGVCYDADFTPFGGELAYTNTCPAQNNYKFEGKERDTETGNDDFGARYYTWRFGRWLSADWSAVPVPVPYANLTNPQTLNLYAMVADDAETYADLDGHCCDLDDAVDYGVGVLRGFASSLTFGAVGAPKSEDSTSSRAGQASGSALAGITGEITADAGKGGMVAGLAAEAPSLGTSTTLVVAGAGTAALGTVVEAGAAANLARLATTPIQSSGMAPKPGESGGPGAGKVFDAETKQAAKSENAAANGGEARCVYCGVKVTNEPGPNRVNVDHAVARANGGTNTLENAQVACQYCNQSKGTGSAPKTPRQLDQQPDVVDPGPTT